ncbi:cell division protein ZapA [Roseateles sp. BYS180W]|uniref:Cell division protein ZapA n=1 Tax=Roseateles rivi TaxID=3299028 RepID=A0ABW7FZ96_9BURK
MKQIEVTIMGQSYLLGCPPGGESALARAVARVDKEMCSIRDSGRIKARERIAVLAALNLAFSGSDETHSTSSETGNEAPADLGSLIRRLDEALEFPSDTPSGG